ncbi:hypothetical protein AYO38_09450 [bacterium SCGC AG-212-C10]|nr:hypothetical protein AYO38_09450 [bacterium SCGC AG-212-C10]
MTVRATHSAVVEAISELTLSMPLGQLHSLAGTIDGLPRFDSILSGQGLTAIANPSFRDTTNRLIAAWGNAPEVPGAAIALALRSAAAARQEALFEETVDAVWTGPTSHHVPVRRTREVLLELIEEAHRRLIVVSFAAYKVPDILESLSAAAARGVDIRLILETSEGSGGRLSHDAANAFETARSFASFYVWPGEQRAGGDRHGALHAKTVLADGSAAFVTSANLTGHGLGENMELGLLVRGGQLPGRLTAHFDELIAFGVLRQIK